MGKFNFSDDFKRDAVHQMTEPGYRTGDEVRQDVFDYNEMFYNPTHKHVRNDMLSPVEFERRHKI